MINNKVWSCGMSAISGGAAESLCEVFLASFIYLVATVEVFLAKDGIHITCGVDWSEARLVPRHLLTQTHRHGDLILRERDPVVGPLGSVIHDMILLSHGRVRDPEHDPVVSGSVGSLRPISDADEVGNKRGGGTRDHIDAVGGVPTGFPGLGAIEAYCGSIVSVRRASCNVEGMKTSKDQHSAEFFHQRETVDCENTSSRCINLTHQATVIRIVTSAESTVVQSDVMPKLVNLDTHNE